MCPSRSSWMQLPSCPALNCLIVLWCSTKPFSWHFIKAEHFHISTPALSFITMQEGTSVKLPPVLSNLLQVLLEIGTGCILCREHPLRSGHPTSFHCRSEPLRHLCKPSSCYSHQMCYQSIWFPLGVTLQKASSGICTKGLNTALGFRIETWKSLSDPNWKPLRHINKVCCSQRLWLWIYRGTGQIN